MHAYKVLKHSDWAHNAQGLHRVYSAEKTNNLKASQGILSLVPSRPMLSAAASKQQITRHYAMGGVQLIQ